MIEQFFAQHFPGACYRIGEQPSDAVLDILLQEIIAATLIQHTIGQVAGRFIIIPPDGWRQPLFKAIEVERHGLRKACFESVEANLVQTFAALDDSTTLYDHPLHQHAFEGLHQLGGRGYPVLFDEARKPLLFVLSVLQLFVQLFPLLRKDNLRRLSILNTVGAFPSHRKHQYLQTRQFFYLAV